MKPLTTMRRRVGKPMVLCLLLVLATLLLSSCNGNPQNQQQASQSKQALDSTLANAQSIGVPANLLQPIRQQEQQLSGTSAPLSLFGSQPTDTYYTTLAQSYAQLNTQVTGLETQSTEQLDYQAAQDLQNVSNALAQRQDQGFVETKTFADQLTTYQQALAKAQYPKDYVQIINEAKDSTLALHLMGPVNDTLNSFNQVIQQLQTSHIDVTAFTQEAQADLQSFRNATHAQDYSQLIDLINSQLNETTTASTVAIPFVGKTKLNQFNQDIQLIKQYGGDVSGYQQQFTTDQQNLNNAKSLSDFLHVSSQIDADIASIQVPLTKAQAYSLLNQFNQEVNAWGQTHQFNDTYNHQSYPLDYEYMNQGIGSDDAAVVQSARTVDDYQSAIDLLNNDLMHLHMMEQDSTDPTPFNQVHQTDLALMNHYGVTNSPEVMVVSLVEQTLRYYENGQLVHSFHITSGQFAKPSPPGFWQVFLRESPTVFKSDEPPGSAFWYPDTHINFAMEYHSDGFFFHDSWWRNQYGVGTNFPHYDTAGDEAFAGDGSHGCINMQEQDAGWLYANSHYNAQVILY